MKREKNTRRSVNGFTLVEMMIVVAVIGLLMAGMFKLVSAAGENTKRSRTVARMERLQNALAGFYAEYGTYPPVQAYSNPDPYTEESGSAGTWHEVSQLISSNATRAAGCYATRFLCPTVLSLNDYINVLYAGAKQSVNSAMGGNDYSAAKYYSWDQCRVFMFGMLSYLLPRVELMGGDDLASESQSDNTPNINFFKKNYQWKKNNAGSIRSVHEREKKACSRWMPQLAGCLFGVDKILGEKVNDPLDPNSGGINFEEQSNPSSGASYVLRCIRVKDGWGRDFFYYSAPPHQSYRLWSAGPDGKTFPPWISMEAMRRNKQKDAVLAKQWTEDDIVRFDR